MDGVGIKDDKFGNAVAAANKPTLDYLMGHYPNTQLKAHGTAVGLPSDDDMGNSEVGHNALGCGQVYAQGAKLVNNSIDSGDMYVSQTWKLLLDNVKNNKSALHFIGLMSDGNVHSNISHLKNMITQAKKDGAAKIRVHALLDGRDVPAQSALEYINDLESHMEGLNDGTFDARIASGGGRMKITMDRYEADWDMVKRGWETHVLGIGPQFDNAQSAIEKARAEHAGIIDQDLPPFIIAKDGTPVGTIEDNDSVVLYNFRGDRALEISLAFDHADFKKFDRVRFPKVVYAGMLQYDGDLKIPNNFLVDPPDIKNTLSELLVKHNISQYAVSETQKYGHVTYFWNGNKNEKFSETLEHFYEVPSDKVSFDERPWMKCAEVTDKILEAIQSKQYGFIRANFPNGDMVGHTGNYDAAVIGVEGVDLCLARILKAVRENGCVLIVTADHGNADEMLEKNKKGEISIKTAHTLNPVPFIIFDESTEHAIIPGEYGLANAAATVAKLLGLEAPSMWEKSVI
jgi:2,3-bisphosphoglycerate-independent phosphoglycerate mutase